MEEDKISLLLRKKQLLERKVQLENQVNSEIQDEPIRKSIFPRTPVEMGGTSEEDIIASGIAGTGRDITAIPAHFINQLALNYPRSLTRRAGFEYPEETTSQVAGIAAKSAGVAGAIKNPIFRAIKPAKSILGMAGQGTALGAAYAPTDDPIGPQERAGQAVGGALGGAVVGGAIRGGPRVFKAMKRIGRSIRKTVNPPVPFEERLAGRTAQIEGELSQNLDTQSKNIGENLAPKAAEIIHQRVNSMEPEAMRAIGISSEDVALAQGLKKKFGLKEFPTKSSADKFYSDMVKNTPENVEIPTKQLEASISDPANRLDSHTTAMIKRVLNKSRLNKVGTVEQVPMTKAEYQSIRGTLNSIDPTGEMPNVQAVKRALDDDFGKVQPLIEEAKGRFQLSRQIGKAEKYLDKNNLAKEMQGELTSASRPENIQGKMNLRQKLGKHGEEIMSQLESGEISKAEARRKLQGLQEGPYGSIERQRLFRQKRGRQKLAKIGAAGTAIIGVPEVGRRAFRLLRGEQ